MTATAQATRTIQPAKAAVGDTTGHAGHTKDSSLTALPGKFLRPVKLTFLGAGSGFTPRLLNDLLLIPGQQGGEIALVDIDAGRLGTMERLINKLVAQHGQGEQWRVVASADRRDVLAASDYVVNCIEVSGTACVEHDNDIPLKYGVDQCIGDTIGPGGLFKALRTGPVWLEILRDVAELCPRALVLNYTNPMNILCLAAGRAVPGLQVVGLCHSVQHTSGQLAHRAGIAAEELSFDCAGINHLAWFTRLEHNGRDLYPGLIAAAERDLAAGRALQEGDVDDLVRKDMLVHFGAAITESSGHLSEYLPYYRKNAEALKTYARPGYQGGSRFYASNWPTWRRSADETREAMVRGEKPMDWPRSWEYASWIIEGREKDAPVRVYGNVMNQDASGAGQLITNLPADGCVEVAVMVDRTGLHPCRYGALPPQMAHLCWSNMAMFDLAAKAVIERSVEAAVHALMLDPLTAAVCTPAQIKQMALEMFAAEKEFLPNFK